MSGPRSMTRADALGLAAKAAAGALGCALFAGLLAKLAAPLGGDGLLAAALALLLLLASVATLIGILVLMYALYAALRGPKATTGGIHDE